MTVVLDTITGKPRHPEKAHRPDSAGAAQARLDPRQGAGVEGLRGDARDRARERPAHRVRGGRLPQHRRVLGEEARHLHDHGRHLHARLRLLQRQDRPAGRARSERAGACRARRPRSSASPISSSPRSIATISPTAAPTHFAQTIRAIRARCPHDHDRGADAGFPAQGRRGRAGGRGAARRVQPQSRNRAVALSDGAAGRALFRLAPAAAAGQGDRPDDVHQVRHHGRAWARSGTKCCR